MLNYKNNVMVDIETLGTESDAVILSIGACRFGREGIVQRFYGVVDARFQPENRIDPQTLVWWLTTNPRELANLMLCPERSLPREVLAAFNDFLHVTENPSLVMEESIEPVLWANSPTFDCMILERNAKMFGVPFPSFRQWRDVRTILKVFGYQKNPNNHNALDDAVNQAEAIITVLKGLGQ